MTGSGVDCGGGVGHGEGGAVVPGGPLIHKPGTGKIAGLAENEIEVRAIEVSEIGRETLGGTEGASDLFDGGGIPALRFDSRADGELDESAHNGGTGEDGMFDIDGMRLPIRPAGEIVRRVSSYKTT